MEIAEFQEADREDVLRLRSETFGKMNLASFLWQPCQQVESLEQDCVKFVYKDEAVRGYAAAYRLDETHFRLNMIVDPRHTRRGIGTFLLNRMEAEVRDQGGKYLQARPLENMSSGLQFALSREFMEVHRMRGMLLRSSDFSYEKWEGLGEKLSAMGFLVTTLQEETAAGHDPIYKLAELHRRARQGWPSPDPTQKRHPSTEGLKSLFTNIQFPDRFSIMKFKGEYVGYTSAKNLTTATAVHPDYRGLGIATYLKAYDIKKCVDDGQEYFESASANPAMQRVNEKLGYRFNGLAEVRLVKYL